MAYRTNVRVMSYVIYHTHVFRMLKGCSITHRTQFEYIGMAMMYILFCVCTYAVGRMHVHCMSYTYTVSTAYAWTLHIMRIPTLLSTDFFKF